MVKFARWFSKKLRTHFRECFIISYAIVMLILIHDNTANIRTEMKASVDLLTKVTMTSNVSSDFCPCFSSSPNSQKILRETIIKRLKPNVTHPERTITSFVDIPTNFGYNHSHTSVKFTILWYNSAGWLKDRNKILQMNSCEYNNCRFTEDRAHLNTASAIIFGISSENIGEYPPINRTERNPDQIWIHYSREAPVYHVFFPQYKNTAWRDVMNWSMNFNFDADIFYPYGKFVTKKHVKERNYDNIYNMKNKTALWLVSYCDSRSQRYEYVQALQKAGLQVDVYGYCDKNGRYNGDVKQLIKQYKFYLSMENSFCKYYVTEKVFDRFNEDVITVIRGGVDYSQLLPKGTYIDVSKFSNVSKLVQYLNKLGSDRRRYADILRKKDAYYTLNEHTFGHQYALCDICRKMNTFKGQRKTYNDLEKQVFEEGRCTKPEDIVIE